jgi:hypothetical protein
VAKFLQGWSKVEIVDLIYNHPKAIPKAARSNASRPASAVLRPDKEPMAQWNIREWAVGSGHTTKVIVPFCAIDAR